jgi:hypothetical protein
MTNSKIDLYEEKKSDKKKETIDLYEESEEKIEIEEAIEKGIITTQAINYFILWLADNGHVISQDIIDKFFEESSI